MSSGLVFPSLPGLGLGIKKASNWATIVQTTATLREIRTALASVPLYNFELPYAFLRLRYGLLELQQIQGFINMVQGAFNSWFFVDPIDNFVANQQIGTGDGVTTTFQIIRSYGGYSEQVAYPNVATFQTDPLMWAQDLSTPMWPFWQPTLMWLGGAGLGPFTISNPGGIVTFATPPPLGTPIYVSGLFYYLCRFMSDANEFDQEMVTFWTHSGLQFKGAISGNKI